MNLGQIKRFINDSLVPLNRLIGSPSDDETKSTLFGLQKKMLMSGGSGVKAVYRGTTTGAQTVELPAAVNMNKSFIYSVSKGSAGYVAARGTVSIPETDIRYKNINSIDWVMMGLNKGLTSTYDNSYRVFIPAHTAQISGGSTNLTVKEYSARLIDETHIQTDGAVEWQLIEYN